MLKLEVFSSPKTGRGLKCTDSVKRGTTVLSSEPYAYLLSKKHRGLRCDHCFLKQETLLRCSGCKLMRYCDRTCQKNDWRWHKPECAALKRVAPKIPPDFVILMGRVLWRLKSSSSSDNETDSLVSVVELESNYAKLTSGQQDTLAQLVTALHSYWGLDSLPEEVPGVKSVLQLCAKLKNNSFAICDEELQSDIGTGVYLNCSLINHSCVPNCVAVFEKLKLNIRATRDLTKGEEIVISYIDLLAPTNDRQEELQSVYRFACSCKACTSKLNDSEMLSDFDGTILEVDSVKLNSIKAFLEDLKKLQEEGKFEEIKKLATGYISRKVLPAKNVHMTRIYDFAMDACIELRNFEEALAYGASALESYKAYLQEVHPLTGLQMMKLGKILLYLSKNSEAMNMLIEALKILQITHGPKSSLVQELRRLVEQCQIEMKEWK